MGKFTCKYDYSFLEQNGVRDQLEIIYRQGGSKAVKCYVVEDLGQEQFKDTTSNNLIRGLRNYGCPLKLSDDEYFLVLKKSCSSESRKQLWTDTEYRKKQSASRKQLWTDDEFRQKQSDSRSTEEYRQKQSASRKQLWTDEEYSQKQSEERKRRWADEEYRQKMTESRSTEEYRQKQSESHMVHNWPSKEDWFSG
jgi:hypothetical protein